MITANGMVMLGRTVPDERPDGRTFVCSIGWHPDLGLIRIYPLAKNHGPRRWDVVDARLERNPKDSRRESWMLADDRSPDKHSGINLRSFANRGKVPEHERPSLLPDKVFVPSIREANERKLSIAVIRPQQTEVVWTRPDNRDPVDAGQMALFDMEDARTTLIPRLRFRDEAGDHLLQIRDWGVYQLISREGQEYAQRTLAGALHLGESSALLVGNLKAHRNVWLIVGVLNILQAERPALFAM